MVTSYVVVEVSYVAVKASCVALEAKRYDGQEDQIRTGKKHGHVTMSL